MQNISQEVHVRRLAGSATLGLAVSATGMSIASAFLAPLGLWPSVLWAVVACASGLLALQVGGAAGQPMRDVIAGVEAERSAPSGIGRRLGS